MGIKMHSTMNRRVDNRITKVLKVKIHAQAGYAWGVLKNLSLDGLYLKTNYALAKGEAIAIELRFPDGNQSHVKGLVRRIETYPDSNWNFGLGVKLIRKDEHYRNYLHTLIERVKRVNEELVNQQGGSP
jgi:hypothetical protein